MVFRIHYKLQGTAHVRCKLYVAESKIEAGAQAGHFTLRLEEFAEFRRRFKAEYINDHPVKPARIRAKALQAG